jgi:hypothetical protein
MRITKIEKIDRIYHVTMEPGFLSRLFGAKTKTERFKDSGNIYTFGGGTVYIRENGEKLGNNTYIDWVY